MSLVEYQRLTYVLTLQSRTEKACASDQGRVGEVVQCKQRSAYVSVVQLATPTVAAFVLSPIWDGFGTLEREGAVKENLYKRDLVVRACFFFFFF